MGRRAPNADRPSSLQLIVVATHYLMQDNPFQQKSGACRVELIQPPWLDGGLPKRNPKTQPPKVIRFRVP